jgi:hypothetical protein
MSRGLQGDPIRRSFDSVRLDYDEVVLETARYVQQPPNYPLRFLVTPFAEMVEKNRALGIGDVPAGQYLFANAVQIA